MSRVRQLLSICIGLCLVTPFIGTGGWLRKEKSDIRKEVKHQILAGMDKADLVLLKFSQEEVDTELRWKHTAEFEYKDRMYDIVETSTQEDSIVFWCWADHAETGINQMLDDLIEQALLVNSTHNHDRQQKNHKQLIDFLKTLYHDRQNKVLSLSQSHILKPAVCAAFVCERFLSSPPSPPPEIV